MLDVLTAIKNNNVNRIPNYDPTLAEHLRKILKTVCVNGKYVNTLNISLDDLLNVQMRGKWWVVGSAWTGNIDDIGNATATPADKMQQTIKNEQKFSEQLLELARKQRMNTDERRNVFCILMSAEVSIPIFLFSILLCAFLCVCPNMNNEIDFVLLSIYFCLKFKGLHRCI